MNRRSAADEVMPALERTALVANDVAAFMLGGGNLPGVEMARIFIASTRSIERALRRFDVPFIASMRRSSSVRLPNHSQTSSSSHAHPRPL